MGWMQRLTKNIKTTNTRLLPNLPRKRNLGSFARINTATRNFPANTVMIWYAAQKYMPFIVKDCGPYLWSQVLLFLMF